MYQYKLFGNVMVTIFSEDVTLTDIETLASDVDTLTQTLDEIFIVGLPINPSSYPTNMRDLVKSLNLLKSSVDKVKRLYGIQFNPLISFLSTAATQILRVKGNTIEAKDINDLYRLMTVEGEQFPALRASLVHLDDIKAYIAQFDNTLKPERDKDV